jgi:hypothetical protein
MICYRLKAFVSGRSSVRISISMVTLGIDLSSMPEGTAACRIDWLKNRAVARLPVILATSRILDVALFKYELSISLTRVE